MNKEKLQSFTDEMLNEIKDLKDLTKQELPLIAKEYIRYQTLMSLVGVIGGICLLLVTVAAGLVAFFNSNEIIRVVSTVFAIFSGLLGMLMFFSSLDEYLYVRLQPRRTAIKAITTLL